MATWPISLATTPLSDRVGFFQPAETRRSVWNDLASGPPAVVARAVPFWICEAGARLLPEPSQPAPRHDLGGSRRASDEYSDGVGCGPALPSCCLCPKRRGALDRRQPEKRDHHQRLSGGASTCCLCCRSTVAVCFWACCRSRSRSLAPVASLNGAPAFASSACPCMSIDECNTPFRSDMARLMTFLEEDILSVGHHVGNKRFSDWDHCYSEHQIRRDPPSIGYVKGKCFQHGVSPIGDY